MIQLHTAEKYEIRYARIQAFGWTMMEGFNKILEMFDVTKYGELQNEDEHSFELLRDELEKMVQSIQTHDEAYRRVKDELTELLKTLNFSEEKLVNMVKAILEKSDSANYFVYVSWF